MDQKGFSYLRFKCKDALSTSLNLRTMFVILFMLGFYFVLNQNLYRWNSICSISSSIKSNRSSRLIVVSHFNEDLDWLDLFIGEEIPHLVYTRSSDPLARHNIAINKGREAVAYLRFIVDHYENLPQSIAFVHGHRTSWHQRDPSDVVVALRAARWHERAYIPLTSTMTSAFFRSINNNEQATINALVWNDVLQKELGPPPALGTRSPCCASFIVKREAILAHRKEFYFKVHDYLLASPHSDQLTGRTLEYTWHMIFGQAAHFDPRRCDFFFCDEKGQVSVVRAENRSSNVKI